MENRTDRDISPDCTGASVKLRISDFCDMGQFKRILCDWARGTGLATAALDENGEYIGGYYNFTEFCFDLTRKSKEGLRRCVECDKKGYGIYMCHAGLIDFALPITLEDGTVLGKIFGGQVLPERPNVSDYSVTARELGIDENEYINALYKVNVRTRDEIEASAALLSNIVNMFVRTSYDEWKSEKFIVERANIISSLSKIYFCDYYVDIDADKFCELDASPDMHTFIGSEGAASCMLDTACHMYVEDEYVEPFKQFIDIGTLKERMSGRSNISYDFKSKKSGWCRAVFIVVTRNNKGEVTHAICALQHIQEEKEKELRARHTLERAAVEANEANKSKIKFLSSVSHDMRTPLNGIIGMTYIAESENNPEETKKCLSYIDTSSKFLLGLINDILDMAKAESGKIVLHPEPYTIEDFLDYMEAVIRPLCKERDQEFTMSMKIMEDYVPLFDKLRINQIAFNLLSNAVKYTPEGGKISFEVIDKAMSDGRVHVTLKVSDTGVGMSREFLDHLFEPFVQENRDDASERRGSGLGLAITKQLADLMGAKISVDSVYGEGTTFKVDLVPEHITKAEADAYSKRDSNSIAKDAFRGVHILLCEDHPLNQEIVKTLLENKGAIVDVAEHGLLGLKAFRNSPIGFYRAILMDIRMPVMNGYEATKAIRQLKRDDAGSVPIIAMTADAFSDDVQKCLDNGMNDHIAKPIKPERFFHVLTNSINGGVS